MEKEKVLVCKSDLAIAINTLKQIDVRGFESMDYLVGTVIMLERLYNQAPVQNDNNIETKPEQ